MQGCLFCTRFIFFYSAAKYFIPPPNFSSKEGKKWKNVFSIPYFIHFPPSHIFLLFFPQRRGKNVFRTVISSYFFSLPHTFFPSSFSRGFHSEYTSLNATSINKFQIRWKAILMWSMRKDIRSKYTLEYTQKAGARGSEIEVQCRVL